MSYGSAQPIKYTHCFVDIKAKTLRMDSPANSKPPILIMESALTGGRVHLYLHPEIHWKGSLQTPS